MAYIAPNSEIALLKNVPLDASYDHTVTFANSTQQYLYFRGKVSDGNGRIFPQNSYQRTSSNKIRLELDMSEAIQYNYLYFRNISFENKYFYAFITNWEYVNNSCVEISYQIDVMQTFLFDYTLKQCFVEREHSNTDAIGENTVPETLEQGEYIIDGTSFFKPYTKYDPTTHKMLVNGDIPSAIFYCTFFEDKEYPISDYNNHFKKFEGGQAYNVYTGLLPIEKHTPEDVADFIKYAAQSQFKDGIIAAYMCPYAPVTYDLLEWDNIILRHNTLAGYVPKNKKLLTYPYNCLRVRTDSDSTIYRWEFFGQTVKFRMLGLVIPEPTLILYPLGYNLPQPSEAALTANRMTIKEFPQFAIDVDVWKVYFAQHGASLVTSMIGSAVETGAKLLALSQGGLVAGAAIQSGVSAKGNPIMTPSAPMAGNMSGGLTPDPVTTLQGASSITGIATSLAQIYELTQRPPELKGTQTSLADYSIGAKQFYFDNLCIRPEYARIIDDYFTMFGYATHRVKIPNVHGRPYFNYVQTKACILEANVPEIYKQQIINIFNRGITFWHSENLSSVALLDNLVGDYTVDNSPS